MDLSHLIKQLYAERDRVSGVIATLEAMQQTGSHPPDSARSLNDVAGNQWVRMNARTYQSE
jgi:hypothetical protein